MPSICELPQGSAPGKYFYRDAAFNVATLKGAKGDDIGRVQGGTKGCSSNWSGADSNSV
jgi:hypothetical protein